MGQEAKQNYLSNYETSGIWFNELREGFPKGVYFS